MWLQPREADVPALFFVFIVLPVVANFLLGAWHTATEMKRREDAERAETMEYLIPTTSFMNVRVVEPEAEDVLRTGITDNLRPPTSSRNVCAVCNRPTSFRCKQCKAVKYCSFKCQIQHWRQGHKDECKKCHDNGASSYGEPAAEGSQHMPFLRNLNSPLGDCGIQLHDMNFNIWSESIFPATDSSKQDTDPVSIEKNNLNKSNQSPRMNELDAFFSVPWENNNHSVLEVSHPSEILLEDKVSDSDNFSYSDTTSGNCDATYPVNPQQPDIRKRKNASMAVYKPDIGVNLTSGLINSREGTGTVSSIEPLLRSFTSEITIEHEALEQLLIDASAKAIMLSYAVLKDITNNFSEVIGGGGSGEVYMGVLRNGKIAVKKLHNTEAFTEKQFEAELTCLIRVKHKNIVRLLGYCSDTQQKVVEYNGRLVLADIRRRFLCFEYASNKSLDDYLKDESHGREWYKRYRLIEGICQGLHYLHKENITHLDLKPGNILLDANMVPKITDFGLSRRFSGAESRVITKNICGSLGYIAPELLERGEISLKSDIFSLGILIRNLLRGTNDLSVSENNMLYGNLGSTAEKAVDKLEAGTIRFIQQEELQRIRQNLVTCSSQCLPLPDDARPNDRPLLSSLHPLLFFENASTSTSHYTLLPFLRIEIM